MRTDAGRTPDLVPVLSAGKHRSARKGACFMEMASYLAGERWSDHPACTHPLLAELARQVNDRVSDEGRQRLVPLIPDVIGLTSESPDVDARLALLAASTALPVAAQDAQRALAVAVLTSNRVLAAVGERSQRSAEIDSSAVLATAPHAATWAARFSRGDVPTVRAFRRHAAPHAVHLSAEAIAESTAPDADRLLLGLLEQAIESFPAWAGTVSTVVVTPAPTPTSTTTGGAAAPVQPC